jgi:hypothetical protein
MLHSDGEKSFGPYASLKDGRVLLAEPSQSPGETLTGWFAPRISRLLILIYNDGC